MTKASPSRLKGDSPRCLPNRLTPPDSTFMVSRPSSRLRQEAARLIPTIQTMRRSTPLAGVSRYHSRTDFTLSSHLVSYRLSRRRDRQRSPDRFSRISVFQASRTGIFLAQRGEDRLAVTLVLASNAPTAAICHLNAPKLLSARWKLSLMTCARADDHCIGGLLAVG
jgi:hypothetical protein